MDIIVPKIVIGKVENLLKTNYIPELGCNRDNVASHLHLPTYLIEVSDSEVTKQACKRI